MESTSAPSSRFRFRDNREMEDSSENSSQSGTSDRDDDSELESMTGKGIKRLCSELVELKAASDEDFVRNIFSNYSAFIRIFEEVGSMENELVQLKNHVSTQKKLVKDLTDGIYLKALSEDTLESIIEESFCAEPPPLSNFEAHTNDVLDTLDILLSENSLEEALAILELEDEYFQRMQLEENIPSEELMFHNSAISGRKAMITLQLTLVAENPRVAAPELQKALVGLCRLGDNYLATHLLLKYYHSRIATGTHNLQCSKSFLYGVYVRELAKFVFSMISQAARSFIVLYGETSPYASELIQWAREETEVFVACFNKYIKSISEISGGLSIAVESMQFALSFCSLLESQRLVLRPYLIKLIRPCIEEVLHVHIDHFKKVIRIFTATDGWVLGRYLVSGILNDGCSSMVIGQQLEYSLLTSSGRKFVTLLQSIAEDITPLVSLQMEGSVLRELINLFTEYAVILEKAITCETNVTETGGSRNNLAESLQQQVSVLVNLSTLEHFFSSILRSIFEGISYTESELMVNHSIANNQKELDGYLLYSQETYGRLRAHFYQQFIYRMTSAETYSKITQETCIDILGNLSMSNYYAIPSVAFQVLFLEIRKLEKLAQDNVFEINWLMELLRELIQALFVWISNNKEIWATKAEKLTVQQSDNFKQMVLDMHFLAEIASYGGYFSNNPMVLVTLMKSAFLSIGLDTKRDAYDDGWAINAASEAVQKLLEIENIKSPPNEEPCGVLEQEPHGEQSEYATESPEDESRSSLEDFIVSDEDSGTIDASKTADTDLVILNSEFGPLGGSLDLIKEEDSSDSRRGLTNCSIEFKDFESEKIATEACDETRIIEKTNSQLTLLSKGTIVGAASETGIPIEERASIEPHVSKPVTNKLEDTDTELPETAAASTEDSVRMQSQDEINNVELKKDFEDDEDNELIGVTSIDNTKESR